jgi:hypothetical protein
MLGRALFVFVWLIIAAGLALPMYPPVVETAGSSSPASILHAADSSWCRDCPLADDGPASCPPDCSCGHLLPAVYLSVEDSSTLRIRVIVRPSPVGPPSEVQPLPPKLPAI